MQQNKDLKHIIFRIFGSWKQGDISPTSGRTELKFWEDSNFKRNLKDWYLQTIFQMKSRSFFPGIRLPYFDYYALRSTCFQT